MSISRAKRIIENLPPPPTIEIKIRWAMMFVALRIDQLHSKRPPTRDELRQWFAENVHHTNLTVDELEEHAGGIVAYLEAIRCSGAIALP